MSISVSLTKMLKDAVTPTGKPDAVTDTDEEKPLTAESETVQVAFAPAASERPDGAVERAKSPEVGEVEPDPPEPQPEARIRTKLRTAKYGRPTGRIRLVGRICKLFMISNGHDSYGRMEENACWL